MIYIPLSCVDFGPSFSDAEIARWEEERAKSHAKAIRELFPDGPVLTQTAGAVATFCCKAGILRHGEVAK